MLSVIFDWIFSWSGTSILVIFFVTTGLAVMTMTPPACLIARICLTIAAILLLVKIVIFAISTESSTLNRIISTFVIFGIIGIIYVEALQGIKIRELLQLSGVLTPDNKPTPPHICKHITKKSYLIFLGNSVAYTSAFPHTVILAGGHSILTINIVNNKLTINAQLFDIKGNIIAEINDNKFTINHLNYFKIERPNYHQLIVYDQKNIKILSVYYLNPKVIKFLGRFNVPHLAPIIIDENMQDFAGMQYSGSCIGGASISMIIF